MHERQGAVSQRLRSAPVLAVLADLVAEVRLLPCEEPPPAAVGEGSQALADAQRQRHGASDTYRQ